MFFLGGHSPSYSAWPGYYRLGLQNEPCAPRNFFSKINFNSTTSSIIRILYLLLAINSELAIAMGLEPTTFGVTGRRSHQLNYATIFFFFYNYYIIFFYKFQEIDRYLCLNLHKVRSCKISEGRSVLHFYYLALLLTQQRRLVGTESGTRTHTSFNIRFWGGRVYQFRHFGIWRL